MSRAQLIWRLRALWANPVSLGVRCLVMDPSKRILLVRHTYISGWHLPGGGVDPHETTAEAAIREVAEETGISLKAKPEFFGLYLNRALAGRDHVAMFVAHHPGTLTETSLRKAAGEIAEVGVFAADALPDGATKSVSRRLDEVLGGMDRAEYW